MGGVYPGSLGGTYGGNPIACSVALKVIEIMQRENIPERAAKLGVELRRRLEELQERHEVIGDVRGLGPMLAMELVKDRKTKEPYGEAASKVIKEALSRGLLLLKAGLYGNCIRLHPPLTIEEELLDRGMDILDEALKSL